MGELLLWGQLELTSLGEQKNSADCPLTFRKKKFNLAEIPVPQFKMGILTFALLGQHDQMRRRSNVLLLFTGYPAGHSYGAESDYMEPRLAPARDGLLFPHRVLYFQLCLGHEQSCGGKEVGRRASEAFCHRSPLWTLGYLLYVHLGRCTAALWLGTFRTWHYCFLLPLRALDLCPWGYSRVKTDPSINSLPHSIVKGTGRTGAQGRFSNRPKVTL